VKGLAKIVALKAQFRGRCLKVTSWAFLTRIKRNNQRKYYIEMVMAGENMIEDEIGLTEGLVIL